MNDWHVLWTETEAPANKYAKFVAMIGVSTVAMLGLIYLNTYGLNHVFFSKTRAYWLS